MAIFQRKAGVTGQVSVAVDRQRREISDANPRLHATDPLDILKLRKHSELEEVDPVVGAGPLLPVVKAAEASDTITDDNQIVATSVSAGQSLARASRTSDFVITNGVTTDIPTLLTGEVTIPASGMILVLAYCYYALPAAANSAPGLVIQEAPVVDGVTGTFAPVQLAWFRQGTATGYGMPLSPSVPLTRTPGAKFVYKVQGQRVVGTGNVTFSALEGSPMYLEVLAR
jgi:hypothetical protein